MTFDGRPRVFAEAAVSADPRVLSDDEVCACLHETGERKVRLYERCQRCGAFMEADYASMPWQEKVLREREEALVRVATLEAALRLGRNYINKLSDPHCPPIIAQVALDAFDEAAREALEGSHDR